MILLALAFAALMFFWGLGAYNRIMRLRNGVALAWQQLELPLSALAADGAALAEAGPRWLPQEGPAFDALMGHSQALAQAVAAVRQAPYATDPVAELAVAHALQASALQRVIALLEHHVQDEDSERAALVAKVLTAQQQREFGRQLFNQRVLAYNEAVGEVPTRALAGLYGFHDAKSF
jgi:LemA protein